MGGKARGLAFLDHIIKQYQLADNFENTLLSIPRTVVLATDVFDEFMSVNNLYATALSVSGIRRPSEKDVPPDI